MVEAKKVEPASTEPYTFLKHTSKDWEGKETTGWCLVENNIHKSKHWLPKFKQFNGCGGATMDGIMDFYDLIAPKYDFTKVWKDCTKYLYQPGLECWQMPRAYMLLNLSRAGTKWLRDQGLVEICATPNVYHGANGLGGHCNTLCYWDWTHLLDDKDKVAKYKVVTPEIVLKEKQAA